MNKINSDIRDTNQNSEQNVQSKATIFNPTILKGNKKKTNKLADLKDAGMLEDFDHFDTPFIINS